LVEQIERVSGAADELEVAAGLEQPPGAPLGIGSQACRTLERASRGRVGVARPSGLCGLLERLGNALLGRKRAGGEVPRPVVAYQGMSKRPVGGAALRGVGVLVDRSAQEGMAPGEATPGQPYQAR